MHSFTIYIIYIYKYIYIYIYIYIYNMCIKYIVYKNHFYIEIGVCNLGDWDIQEKCARCGSGYTEYEVKQRVKYISSADGRVPSGYQVDFKYLDTAVCQRASSKITPCQMRCQGY